MGKRTCATWEGHKRLLQTDPAYAKRMEKIEAFTRDWVKKYAGAGLRTGVVVIPVVVHVVWRTAEQNISDAQIQSQIDVLNQDFRR